MVYDLGHTILANEIDSLSTFNNHIEICLPRWNVMSLLKQMWKFGIFSIMTRNSNALIASDLYAGPENVFSISYIRITRELPFIIFLVILLI